MTQGALPLSQQATTQNAEKVPADPATVGTSGQLSSGSFKAKADTGSAAFRHTAANMFMLRVEPSERDLRKYNAIFERGLEMDQRKEARMQQIRQELLDREMAECHFQPHFASGTVARSYPSESLQPKRRAPLSRFDRDLPREWVTFSSVPSLRMTTGPFSKVEGVRINGVPQSRISNTDHKAGLRRHAMKMGAPPQLTSGRTTKSTTIA